MVIAPVRESHNINLLVDPAEHFLVLRQLLHAASVHETEAYPATPRPLRGRLALDHLRQRGKLRPCAIDHRAQIIRKARVNCVLDPSSASNVC
jgi:hypothetical protein